MKAIVPFLLLTFQSCSLFDSSPKIESITDGFNSICLNGEGSGRIHVNSQNYVFSYESALIEEELKLVVLMNFPLYGQERFEMTWDSEQKRPLYIASYEQMILRSQSGIDLNIFKKTTSAWKKFFTDYLVSRKLISHIDVIKWEVIKKKEFSRNYNFKDSSVNFNFNNLKAQSYFGRMDFKYTKNSKKTFGLEFIVRKCMSMTE